LGNCHILLAREVTKAFEEWLEGPVEALQTKVGEPRGEFVIVIPPQPPEGAGPVEVTDDDLRHYFCQITENGSLGRRAAIRELARRTGRSSKEIYAALERTKYSG
jgi:16S rRNA C1402 (ribose-2'-O) methylase RsmI